MSLLGIAPAQHELRLLGIIQITAGLFNIGLAIYLFLVWRMMGVFLAGATAVTTKNLLFMPAFTAKLLNCPSLTFLHATLIATVASFPVLFLAQSRKHFIQILSWEILIVASLSISLVSLFGAYFLAFTKEERPSVKR